MDSSARVSSETERVERREEEREKETFISAKRLRSRSSLTAGSSCSSRGITNVRPNHNNRSSKSGKGTRERDGADSRSNSRSREIKKKI